MVPAIATHHRLSAKRVVVREGRLMTMDEDQIATATSVASVALIERAAARYGAI